MITELRIAVRTLCKAPGFSLLAISTLGLGIGLVSTQFSLLDGVFLRPLPFKDAARLWHVSRQSGTGSGDWAPFSVAEFLAHREQQRTFEALTAFQSTHFNLSRAGAPPLRLEGLLADASFFKVLQTEVFLGTPFSPGDDRPGESLRVILAYDTWEQAFSANRDLVGSSVQINGESATIQGVMPKGFRFPGREDCWVSLRLDPRISEGKVPIYVQALGRLRKGADPQQAAEEWSVLQQQLDQENPERRDRPSRVVVRPLQFAHAGSGTATLLATMQAMTVLVLVLACVNVANLLLARASGRTRDLAIRSALGAERTHLFGQLLTESTVLACGGFLVGLLLATLGTWLLQTQVAPRIDLASWIRFEVNARTLGVTFLAALVSGLAAGAWPALRACRIPPSEALKDGSHGGTGFTQGRLARWLASGQLIFASALAVAAGILAVSAVRSSRVNLGYDPKSLLVGRIELSGERYETPEQRVAFYADLEQRLHALPGVLEVAISSRDLVSQGVFSHFEIGSQNPHPRGGKPGAWLEVVTHDYFRMLDRHPIAGRTFERTDSRSSPVVALVNQSFARAHWPNENPIGQRLRRDEPDAPWATVVGVVPDLTMEGVGNRDPAAGWYLLQDQQAWGWMNLLIRTQTDPASLIPVVRQVVASIDSEQPVHSFTTLEARTARRVAGLELVGTLALVFAITALILSGIGSYGVMAFNLRQRGREFGVRIALGATHDRILALLLRENALLTMGTITLGLGLGYALALPFAPFVPQVSTSEPALYVSVGALMATVALLAVVIPARRSARIDPSVTLRGD